MELNKYIETTNRTDFARAVGVSPDMVYQWIKGIRPVSAERCVAIEQATAGAVTRKDLRPDDWHLIWPELTNKEAA
jgi:DNA-binding transcriptional regulator YdaS (Cro superfamily)